MYFGALEEYLVLVSVGRMVVLDRLIVLTVGNVVLAGLEKCKASFYLYLMA